MSGAALGTTSGTRLPHRLILASAGTGKTFQLANHFLRLLLTGVEPDRILATTFTRKAAGEILSRILEGLAEAVQSDKKREELAAQLGDADTSAGHLQETLADLTRRLDRFQVSTLDAYFSNLCRLFTLDLGLPLEWSILDDVEKAERYTDATARLLEQVDAVEYADRLFRLQLAATRSTHEALFRVVQSARQLSLECEGDAWSQVALPNPVSASLLAEALQRLEQLDLPLTKKGTPNRHWESARDDLLERFAEEDWAGFMANGLAKRALAGEEMYSRHPIPPECADAIRTLLQHANRDILAYILEQNGSTSLFLTEFERALRSLRAEGGGLAFEDLPHALAPLTGESPLLARGLSLWFRRNAQVDHLLLDEFQDTAPAQWRVLDTLARAILGAEGKGRSFFCVGDRKQSIYGWRSAEPRLLGGLPERFPVLAPTHLDESWRSSPLILDTVNQVFGGLAAAKALREGPAGKAAAEWDREYRTHSAAPPNRQLPGAAYLLEAPFHKETLPAERAVLALAVERVQAILEEGKELRPDHPPSIGILLRRRKHIARFIHLLARRGIHASDEGGNPLVDSEAVLQMLSLLHLADHPGDTAAAFHVASSPFGKPVGLALDNYKDHAASTAAAVRQRLQVEGLGSFVTSFNAIVVSEERFADWDRRRFGQLVDLANRYESRLGLRPSSFVDHVRATKVENTAASQVKVMTIHSAKGLEFDAVVLPELDCKMVPSTPSYLTERPDPYGPIRAITHAPPKASCQLEPCLARMREEWEERELRESLCLLYVAMTRAAHRIDMVVQGMPSGKTRENTSKRWSSLLCNNLSGPEQEPGGQGTLWVHPDNAARWLQPEDAKAESSSPGTDEPGSRPFVLAPSTTPRSLPRRAPSSSDEENDVTASLLLGGSVQSALDFGSCVHRLFEELEWSESLVATDAELLAMLTPLTIDEAMREQALAQFRAALANANFKEAFFQEAFPRPAGTTLKVENERRVQVPLDQGGRYFMNGIIDRLVLTLDGGQPIAAAILDYKTDTIGSAEELVSRTAHHRPQLDAYRSAVSAMTGLPAKNIRCQLAFVSAGELVTV